MHALVGNVNVVCKGNGVHDSVGDEQIRDLSRMGYQGFLIGEALIRSGEPARLIRQLRQVM